MRCGEECCLSPLHSSHTVPRPAVIQPPSVLSTQSDPVTVPYLKHQDTSYLGELRTLIWDELKVNVPVHVMQPQFDAEEPPAGTCAAPQPREASRPPAHRQAHTCGR